MRKFALFCVLGLLCQLLAVPAFLASAPRALASPPTTSVGDAYATGSGCDWTFGTSGIEQTVTYSSGTGSYELTSLENMLDSREYVQGGTASGEFSLGWNGATLTGASGGWTCASATRPDKRRLITTSLLKPAGPRATARYTCDIPPRPSCAMG